MPGKVEFTGAMFGGTLYGGRVVGGSYTALGTGEYLTQFVVQSEVNG